MIRHVLSSEELIILKYLSEFRTKQKSKLSHFFQTTISRWQTWLHMNRNFVILSWNMKIAKAFVLWISKQIYFLVKYPFEIYINGIYCDILDFVLEYFIWQRTHFKQIHSRSCFTLDSWNQKILCQLHLILCTNSDFSMIKRYFSIVYQQFGN